MLEMKHLLILVTAIALTLTSCEMIIDVPLPEHEPELVLLSHFSPNDDFQVHVSTTVGLGRHSSRVTGHEKATVEVWSDEGLVAKLQHTGQGIYRAEGVRPQEGVVYSIRASATGLPDARGEGAVPAPVPFDIRYEETRATSPSDFDQLRITINFDDPGQTRNFYRLEVDRRVTHWEGTAIHSQWFKLVDPSIVDDFWDDDPFGSGDRHYTTVYFHDARFSGETVEITLLVDLYDRDDRAPENVRVRLAVLSEDYITYRQTVELQQRTHDNPFAEPVQIFSNVIGGRGLVAGYNEIGRWLQ
jgi:hypothetical protein